MRLSGVYISGLGVCLPPTRSVADAVAAGECTAAEVAAGFTGAAVAGDVSPPELALAAAQAAVKQAGTAPGDYAALVYARVWHQGPDGWGPQFYLQRHLVGDDLLSIELDNGCSGTFSAIEVAVGALRGHPDKRAALVATADNFGTPLFRRWSPGGGFSVMGDGGTALVLTREPGFLRLRSLCTTSYSAMEESHRAGEPLFPPGATVGRPLDFGARFEAFKEIVAAGGLGSEMMIGHQQRNLECATRAMAEADVRPADIKRVVTHHIARDDAKAYLAMLGFPLRQSTWSYGSTIGHVGASDHTLGLHHLLSTGQLRPGDHVLLCGFSPGITYKAAVVQVLAVPSFAP